MRALLLALAMLCSVVPLCHAQDVVVRSHIEPKIGAVVGQHVRILIDVLFKGGMPRPPRVTVGEVAGAQVLRTETQATTMTDRIDGQSYTGQRFEFALYPRRGGTITVPPAVVTLLDARGEEAGRRQGQSLQAEISVPPGVDASGPVVASAKVSLDQEWNPPPADAFKAGDALVRTITRTAADVPSMAMRDLAFPVPPGVRVYVEPPRGEDAQHRGDLVGRRVDRVTYVFEAAGAFRIAPVAQPWWDLGGGRLRQAEGAGVSVTVTAAPASHDRRRNIVVVGVVVALLGISGWLALRLFAAWSDWRRRWLQSEAKAFRNLLAACRDGDVSSIYRAFIAWRARSRRPDLLRPLAQTLEEALFAGSVPAAWRKPDRRAFAAESRVLRRKVNQAVSRQATTEPLPPLNPEGGVI